jgi:hypothetical protein
MEARIILDGLTQRFERVAVAGPVDRATGSVIAGINRAVLTFN